jgi:uncharacterized protein (TIGR03083 family)
VSTPDTLIGLLRRSHNELAAHVTAMSPDQIAGPSYCTAWSIGRVLSHLGSGAELAVNSIDAARTGVAQLDIDARKAIWARWDALNDADAATSYLRYEGDFVSYIEKLSIAEYESVRVPFIGNDLSLAQYLSLRLSEHTLHRWDVEIMAVADAELAAEATTAILDVVHMMVPYLGKPANAAELQQLVIAVDLGSHSSYTLDIHDGVGLTSGLPAAPDATLRMPAEAFVRLCYGRLDAGHTPGAVRYDGPGSLDTLRQLFPGV